ncbi:TOBE domain-containing protein (plasmid) [Rhizobium gallicum]|nr:TOBE domain-containing protein [Rhizobium gallicum]
MADRIGIVAEGRLLQVGTPREIYGNPASLHVAARLGQPHINLLPADLLPGGSPPKGTKTIGARTEHLDIIVGKDANAEVDWIEHLGDQNHLHIRVRDHKLVTLADPYLSIRPGDRINLTLRDPLYFDASGQRLA